MVPGCLNLRQTPGTPYPLGGFFRFGGHRWNMVPTTSSRLRYFAPAGPRAKARSRKILGFETPAEVYHMCCIDQLNPPPLKDSHALASTSRVASGLVRPYALDYIPSSGFNLRFSLSPADFWFQTGRYSRIFDSTLTLFF